MSKGFTLLEILLGIGIILLVVVLLSSSLSNFRENNLLTEADATILGLLRDARPRTLASSGNTTYGVHFEETKAVLFKGASYNAADSSNEIYLLPGILNISLINLGGGLVEVIFQRLSGGASSFGTITIISRGDSSKNRVVTILATGSIK